MVKTNTNKKVATLKGIAHPTQPVTPQQVWAFVNANGGLFNCKLVLTSNVNHNNLHKTTGAPNPLPYTNMQLNKAGVHGKRAAINWAAVNGMVPTTSPTIAKGTKQTPHCLGTWYNFGNHMGQTKGKVADLLALLNGGYSPSSATWGMVYATLSTK